MFVLLSPLGTEGALLPNGSAELGIMYWGGVTPTAKDAFSGRYAFEAAFKNKTVSAQPWHSVKVVPGKQYTFSVWARTLKGTCDVSVKVNFPGSKRKAMQIAAPVSVGTAWQKISAACTVPEKVRFIKPSFDYQSSSGKGVILFDDFSVNAPDTGNSVNTHKHLECLKTDSVQGHTLDKAYQVNGQKIDAVIYDFKELAKQGKPVPEDLLKHAEETSANLRKEWWALCCEREKFFAAHTRTSADAVSLNSFTAKISAFEKKAAALCADIEKKAAPFVKDIQYTRKDLPKDFYKDRFILSADFEWCFWGKNWLKYPGQEFNPRYEAGVANELDLDYTTILTFPQLPENVKTFCREFSRYAKMPFLVWSGDPCFIGKDMVNVDYYDKRDKLSADTDVFLSRYTPYSGMAGIQVDEPRVTDFKVKKHFDKAWKEYLESRKEYLDANNVKDPKKTVEWKIFKAKRLGNHLKYIHDMILSKGMIPSICVMPTYEHADSSGSPYVHAVSQLPFAGTDLYRNGSSLENMHMQLFKSAMDTRKAIMLPGSMFSCKTPANYKRSISTGIVHADGLHMWTSTHFSKYRDARSYWRYGEKTPNLDDRKRQNRFNWYPWGYEIMKERYAFARKHSDILANRRSLADVALVVSERTKLAANGQFYWNSCLAYCNELIGMNQPFDVVFLEKLTRENIRQYKLLLAPNCTTATPGEAELLRNYSDNGGVILTTPDFLSKDEWGRSKTPADFGERLAGNAMIQSIEENNIPFSQLLLPAARGKLKELVRKHSRMPYSVQGLPFGVEVQIQKNDKGMTLIHLLDFTSRKEIKGHVLVDRKTGKRTPLPPFNIHDMIVIK